MERCAFCRREIPTAEDLWRHRRRHWIAMGLVVLIAALVSSIATLGLTDYLTIRAQLKVAQRHLTEWQKIQMVDALVEANQTLRKRIVPAAARKDAQGK